MLKIALSGKANSGKDSLADIFVNQFCIQTNIIKSKSTIQAVAFADPIKEIIKIMFPNTKKEILYGCSKHRSTIIEGASLNGNPLTYRALLQNLGTEVCRGYKENIWLDVMDFKIEKAEKRGVKLFLIKDVRFVNEFNHLKNSGFVMVRIVRDLHLPLSHSSEIEQEQIPNNEFHYVVDNNGTLESLRDSIKKLISKEFVI